ncbi:hypothetical protein KCMC57_63840 (plasmid) [Kitasatospora sp. CMC57]|uniref:Uncharacterized protein n=1 Tax=Kitasatospora sp. CMC57 TaxID=3231513 RepID=A0AB33K3E6_9ACTN
MHTIRAESREYVPYAVTATVAGAPHNPTADLVEFRFSPVGTDATLATWHTGSWDPTPNPGTSVYTALCLVGPGGTVTLPAGHYNCDVRITDNPEAPVMGPFLLNVTT